MRERQPQMTQMNTDDGATRWSIVVVGTSWGGVRALQILLSGLPGEFPLPVVLLQHRSPESEDTLCRVLQEYAAMPVKEAEDKEILLPGRAYLAPSGYHLLLEGRNGGVDEWEFALSTEAPVRCARPSIDVLFESAADACCGKVIGVILTGASDDGARGLARIKERGGLAIVQNPSTAESHVMPKAAIAATQADCILPLEQIAPFLVEIAEGKRGDET